MLKCALGAAALVPSAWLLSRQLPLDAWQADLRTATGERRRVTLVAGEVALKVPAAASLTIHTDHGRLSVGAGELCVRQEPRGCRVSVYGGTVQVRPWQGLALAVLGGQRIVLQAAGVGVPEPFDVLQPGWREGVLLAQDQPLGKFLAELSKHRPGVLRWAPELESLRVTGSFRLEDTDRVLALLAASLPLDVQARTRFWVTLRPCKKIA